MIHKDFFKKHKAYLTKRNIVIASVTIVLLLLLPIIVIINSHQQNLSSNAAGAATVEVENGTTAGSVTVVNDANASGGKYARFGIAATPTLAPVLAFPGAEGFGKDTVGGRGGQVIEVTNLNDSGTGSLRAALSASGPRIVVFRVGGIISLASQINVYNDYITVAGQTAPGGGIAIKNFPIRLIGNQMIIRGMRFRPGDAQRGSVNAIDGIGISPYLAPSHHIVLDHNSVSWALDENIETYYEPTDVTISWNISSEALIDTPFSSSARMNDGYGALIGESSKRISFHHNLLAHNNERNPIVKGGTTSEVINNVIYDWRNYGTHTTDPEGVGTQYVNVLNNYYKPGPSTNTQAISVLAGSLYANGNTGAGNIGSSPVTAGSGMNMDTPAQAYTDVLAGAGATAPQRDSIDTRIVSEVTNGTGFIRYSQSEVGGWPTYASGTAPTDTDHDGMPDSWETARGLNPNNAADRNNLAPSGYTWVEEYINSFF